MSGEGVYAAFMRACNVSDDTRRPTERIHLEDAFGQVYPPIDLGKGNRFAYEPRPLQPDACIPAPDTAAARTFDGATLAFAVPFDRGSACVSYRTLYEPTLRRRDLTLLAVRRDPDAQRAGPAAWGVDPLPTLAPSPSS